MSTKPTDDQIKVAAYKVREQNTQGYDAALQAAVRAGVALAAQPAEPATPKRETWPEGPFEVDRMDKDELAQVLYSWDEPLCSGCDNVEAEAIALALNWTPRAAAALRQHGRSVEEAALLAELDGWDMAAKEPK